MSNTGSWVNMCIFGPWMVTAPFRLPGDALEDQVLIALLVVEVAHHHRAVVADPQRGLRLRGQPREEADQAVARAAGPSIVTVPSYEVRNSSMRARRCPVIRRLPCTCTASTTLPGGQAIEVDAVRVRGLLVHAEAVDLVEHHAAGRRRRAR